jgi:hypothetical protein
VKLYTSACIKQVFVHKTNKSQKLLLEPGQTG